MGLSVALSSTKFIFSPRAFSSSQPEEFINGKPTIAYAQKLIKSWSTMSNDQILHFAEMQIPEACRECIVRDIMFVDGIEYDEAMKIFRDIAKSNQENIGFSAYPFYLGLSTSVVASCISMPLVFDLNSVKWFNRNY